jgi:hypothetical protein
MNSLDPVTLSTAECGAVSFPASPFNFTRAAFSKNGRVHIESRCNQCGFRIVGRLHDFDHKEQQHAARCGGLETE